MRGATRRAFGVVSLALALAGCVEVPQRTFVGSPSADAAPVGDAASDAAPDGAALDGGGPDHGGGSLDAGLDAMAVDAMVGAGARLSARRSHDDPDGSG